MKMACNGQMNQQLGMTPQLLQSIRLLYLNAVELEDVVARALEDNPMLEPVDEADDAVDDSVLAIDIHPEPVVEEIAAREQAEISSFDEFAADEMNTAGSGDDEHDPFERVGAVATGGVREHILNQLELELHDRRDLVIAAWLLDCTDDMGYLESDLDELAHIAQSRFNINALELAAIRQKILACEPVGFGARDLRECLLAQLGQSDLHTPGYHCAKRILRDHIELLVPREQSALPARLGLSSSEVAAAIALILTLEPKPGARFAQAGAGIVIPDVVVQRRDGGWHIALNSRATPRLRIDANCERLLGQTTPTAGSQRLRGLLQEARWLTRGLSMRYDTLLRTTCAIVERQSAFLERGEEAMRPLILREIAAAIGMHESSVSRITTGKYMQTPRGTFELKYFFSTPLEGAQVAGVAVRAMVKRLIAAEDRHAPLADDIIAALLARQGVHIARRTVAKYRDLMHIGSAKQRCSDASPRLLAANY